MTCTIYNAFFDWAWPWIAGSILVWAFMEMIKERFSLATMVRDVAGFILAGAVIVLLAVGVLSSGVQSPCSSGDAEKIERIHQMGR